MQAEQTRNFAIIGHSGDGKTSLGEALLHRAGALAELGRVEEGTSVLNYLPEERTEHHTASVTSHLYAFDWRDHHITLVDTPGDPNFQGDGEVALQALDSGVVVVDAGAGVKSGTQRVIDQARELGLPLVAFVNGVDRERADLEQALAGLAEAGIKPVLLSLPAGEPGGLSGAVDLLRGRVVAADGSESDPPEALEAPFLRRESNSRTRWPNATTRCSRSIWKRVSCRRRSSPPVCGSARAMARWFPSSVARPRPRSAWIRFSPRSSSCCRRR